MQKEDIYEFRKQLTEKAKEELEKNPSSIQVTLFETISGEIIPFFLYDLENNEDEECFFKELKDNNICKINHILTMWNNGVLEFPKRSILLNTYKLDEYNANTCVLMLCDNGICGFKLANLLSK